MDHLRSTTTEHKKGKHLSYEERVVIQTRLKDGWTPNRIAREIGCVPNTVRNEIKRVLGRSIEERPPSIDDRTKDPGILDDPGNRTCPKRRHDSAL